MIEGGAHGGESTKKLAIHCYKRNFWSAQADCFFTYVLTFNLFIYFFSIFSFIERLLLHYLQMYVRLFRLWMI